MRSRHAALILLAGVLSCARQAPPPKSVPDPVAAREALPVADASRGAALPQLDPALTIACATAGRAAFDADSVALRFTAAFLKLGVLPIRLSLPSTGGVDAGPVDVTAPVPARLAARATTAALGDGTAYRVEFRVGPPAQGWAAGDSAAATAHAGALCGRMVVSAFK